MASLNKVILIGRLGRDPEVKYLPSGDAVCTFSIATSETWKDKSGQRQEKTEWHNIVIYRKLAEIAGEYLKKGSEVYLEGRKETETYQGKDGTEKQSVKIICNEMKMLGGKAESTGGNEGKSNYTDAKAGKASSSSNYDRIDDDIPF